MWKLLDEEAAEWGGFVSEATAGTLMRGGYREPCEEHEGKLMGKKGIYEPNCWQAAGKLLRWSRKLVGSCQEADGREAAGDLADGNCGEAGGRAKASHRDGNRWGLLGGQ